MKNMGETIQRNVNYDMMKNKGLTRKRKKIDRNPRAKHRAKYEKAIKKRKNYVKEFSQEGLNHKY